MTRLGLGTGLTLMLAVPLVASFNEASAQERNLLAGTVTLRHAADVCVLRRQMLRRVFAAVAARREGRRKLPIGREDPHPRWGPVQWECSAARCRDLPLQAH